MRTNQNFEKLNKPGNKLVQYPKGTFYILNAKNQIVDSGPHLAPFFKKGVSAGKFQGLQFAEIGAIADHLKQTQRAQKKLQELKRSQRMVVVHSKKRTRARDVRDMDDFVKLLGATDPVDIRKNGPALRVSYIDPNYKKDRETSRGIATKVSNF